jgi:hypothetical protein
MKLAKRIILIFSRKNRSESSESRESRESEMENYELNQAIVDIQAIVNGDEGEWHSKSCRIEDYVFDRYNSSLYTVESE